jgi:ADP-ribosylglycohydrolase
MDQEQRTRARNSILGAFVADAASLGFHWVYSQRRISELAPDMPEFRQPDEQDYAGGVGYFAHATKSAGDLSQYGEQMLVMLRSLTQTNGRYDKVHYTEQFRRHFGYGGAYVGYIDRPTRQTLDRIYRDENAAIEAVDAIPYNGPAKDQQSMLTKVLAAVKQYEGQKLRDRVEWYAAAMPDPESSRKYGLALVGALAASDEYPGAIDEQLPAVSKLPPLVACHANDPDLAAICESAIRVTNNAPRAVDYGQICTELLRSSILGAPIASALETAVTAGSSDTREVLNRALTAKSSVREMSKEFGLHCDLGAGVPSLIYNLKTAASFTEAIRANLYAGGDNCGRAIVLGAACGAQFGMGGDNGIPTSWLQQVNGVSELESAVDELLDNLHQVQFAR